MIVDLNRVVQTARTAGTSVAESGYHRVGPFNYLLYDFRRAVGAGMAFVYDLKPSQVEFLSDFLTDHLMKPEGVTFRVR